LQWGKFADDATGLTIFSQCVAQHHERNRDARLSREVAGIQQVTSTKLDDQCLAHAHILVVRDLYLNVLIAFNFLRKNGAQIDVPGRTISFYDHTALTILFTKHDTILALRESIIIPPFTEANVPLKIIGPYHGQTSIIQPLPTVGRLNIAVARAVVKSTGSVAVTNILNPTHKFIRLRRNTQVAFISLLDPCEYAMMPITSAPHAGMEIVEPATHEIHEQTVKDLQVNVNREELTDEHSILDLPGTLLIEAELDTGDAKPIYKKQYTLPPAAMGEVNRQIKELLGAGLMEPSDLPWSSSAIIVQNEMGKAIVCASNFATSIKFLGLLLKRPCLWSKSHSG
jgi:hypothetical protein